MNFRTYRILGLTIIFSMMALIVIVQRGANIVDKYFNPKPISGVEPVKIEPVLSVPTPSKGYFVECMHDDLAIVMHKQTVYNCTCEAGKWACNDKDHRDFKLPKPQRDDSGTL